jgi:hypothetical protein
MLYELSLQKQDARLLMPWLKLTAMMLVLSVVFLSASTKTGSSRTPCILFVHFGTALLAYGQYLLSRESKKGMFLYSASADTTRLRQVYSYGSLFTVTGLLLIAWALSMRM